MLVDESVAAFAVAFIPLLFGQLLTSRYVILLRVKHIGLYHSVRAFMALGYWYHTFIIQHFLNFLPEL